MNNGIPIWRTAFTISDWEWSVLLGKAGRASGMKSRNWGRCPRPILGKLFSRNAAFCEMQGNGLTGL